MFLEWRAVGEDTQRNRLRPTGVKYTGFAQGRPERSTVDRVR